jgi:hypothetical protein
LRRAATFLRKIGIEIGFDREGQARARTIHITTAHALPVLEQAGTPPSEPSASSALPLKVNSAEDASLRTVAKEADGSGRAPVSTVWANTLKNHGETAADGADASITHRSSLAECKGAGWRGRL